MGFQALAFEQPVILRSRCASILCRLPRNLRAQYLTMEVYCVWEFLWYEPSAGLSCPVRCSIVRCVDYPTDLQGSRKESVSLIFFFFSKSLNWKSVTPDNHQSTGGTRKDNVTLGLGKLEP